MGWLTSNPTAQTGLYAEVLRRELRELGYAEDRDIVIEFRSAEGVRDRLPSLAGELVNQRVELLVAFTGEAALAAKQATSSIPIVFILVPDPVGLGLVASLARPGANATGTSTLSKALSGKRLERLKETVPGLARLAILWNANNLVAMLSVFRETEEMARSIRLETTEFRVHNQEELDTALDAIARHRFDGLLMLPASTYTQVAEFAATNRLPAIYSNEEIARAGGLMSLGPNYPALHRKAASYIDKILRGARPAELPVEQATQFDFIVNLSAAERIGLTVPESVVRQATEVIK